MDVAQCYNRIAHVVALLTLCACKVRESSVVSMLTPTQSMEYYLRTRFSESTTYLGEGRPETRYMSKEHGSPTNVVADQLTTDQRQKECQIQDNCCIATHGEKPQPEWHPVQ